MSKLPGRPNLALAGKRENVAQKPDQQTSSKRGKGRQNRGRGGGARKGGGNKKQELIQTSGVFSEGLGGDFPKRKKDSKDVDAQQFTVKKQIKEEEMEVDEVATEAKASFKGWDELWESDDEKDEINMSSIKPKGFISDYKKGKIIPYVLPMEDKPQFLEILDKKLTEIDENDENDMKDVKRVVSSSKMSADELTAMMDEARENFIHLQLPSVLCTLCSNLKKDEQEAMEVEGEGEEKPAPSNKLIPPGKKIGKLQISDKGNMYLKVGGYTINMTSKLCTGGQKGAILLQTEANPEQNATPDTSNANNSIYYLGKIKYNLIGSMEWRTLNDQRKEIQKEVVKKRTTSPAKNKKSKEMTEVMNIQESWSRFSNKWAAGCL